MVDPRVACVMMKRVSAWERKKAAAPPKRTVESPPTYQYTPKGDVDLFAKFFASQDKPEDSE